MDKRIFLIFADTSLEPVPNRFMGYLKKQKKRNKRKNIIILDSLRHYKILKFLRDYKKRGRPDIIHSAVLLAQDSLLNKKGFLNIYIHTINGNVIYVNPVWRPPRHYVRFIGLMEDLFSKGEITDGKTILLKVLDKSISEIIEGLQISTLLAFSRTGEADFELKVLNKLLKRESKIAIIIGAFPKGFFSNEIQKVIRKNSGLIISLGNYHLSTLYVLARTIIRLEDIIFHSSLDNTSSTLE